jgi:hypothetical protein
LGLRVVIAVGICWRIVPSAEQVESMGHFVDVNHDTAAHRLIAVANTCHLEKDASRESQDRIDATLLRPQTCRLPEQFILKW